MAKDRSPPAHVRTVQETTHEMIEQLKALESLAQKFGEGEAWAAKLMATVIYVICHDGHGPIRSLLSQLDVRGQLNCISTAEAPSPGNLLTLPLLFSVQLGGERPSHIPNFMVPELANTFKWIPFTEWWEQPVYSRGLEGVITRKDLVLAVRSKDGGGHFDSELSCAKYVNMKSGSGWKFTVNGEALPNDPIHLLTIWAIGWELFKSLIDYDQQEQ